MARNIKFSLTMKDGYKVGADIEELREHFDLKCVLDYFQRGKLQQWLRQRKYSAEAEAIDKLREGKELIPRLCEILGVRMQGSDETVDFAEIKEQNERLRRLKQYTDDDKLLKLAENTVFSQEEMQELLDLGAEEIILCEARFKIPLQRRGQRYYGVGKAVAVIESDKIVDFSARHIEFHDVAFDERYQQIVDAERNRMAQMNTEEERRQAEENRRQEEKMCRKEKEKRLRAAEERRQAEERRLLNRQKQDAMRLEAEMERRKAEKKRRQEEKRRRDEEGERRRREEHDRLWMEEKRRQEEAEKRFRVEQENRRQREHEKRERPVSPAEVLAEVLGVIMSGNLFGGSHLWYWHYPVDVSGFNFRPWSRPKMKNFLEKHGGVMPDESFFEKEEQILGGIVLKPRQKKEEKKNAWSSIFSAKNLILGGNMIASAVELGAKMLFDSPETMVFTDMAIYFDGMCIPYMQIENVVETIVTEKCLGVRMRIAGEKKPVDLPLMKYKCIDPAAVQLFLLVAMNFYAKITGEQRRQGVTTQEQDRLAKIKLAVLRDDCILDYI